MVTGVYKYHDAEGNLLYYKERIEPGRNGLKKEFVFYHSNRKTGRGGDSILYNLPEVIRSKAVIITEGEKQADLLKSWGLCATSLDSGAGSKLTETMITFLTGKRVAILQDNDEPGTLYASKLAKGLHGKSESLRIVLLPELPDKGDIMDWNGDKQSLIEIIKSTPEWIPPPEKPKKERKDVTATNSKITTEMIELADSYPIDKLLEITGNKALCIVHKEKTPSMIYYPERNKLHCFGCGFSGGAIDVLVKRDNFSFIDAVKHLAGQQNGY